MSDAPVGSGDHTADATMSHELFVQFDQSTGMAIVDANSGPERCSSLGESECLWSAGFIANRWDLIRESGAPQGATDRELILELYLRCGLRAAEKACGPFAWVIWDSGLRALIAVRDRIGYHGLYFCNYRGSTFLSSKLDPLRRVLASPHQLNELSVVAQINCLPPLDGETHYQDVGMVRAGGILVVSPAGVRNCSYWTLEVQPLLDGRSDADFADAYRLKLLQVVREYVPSGASAITLSGGLDSTSVAAALAAVAPDTNLTAFSWISPGIPEMDEAVYSHAAVNHLGIPIVTIPADKYWPASSPEGIKTRISTPYLNFYSELWDVTYLEMRSRGIKIAFSGVGGDHMFGGDVLAYPDMLLTGRLKTVVRDMRSHLADIGRSPRWGLKELILIPMLQAYAPRWYDAPRIIPWLDNRQFQRFHDYINSRSTLTKPLLPGSRRRIEMLRSRWLGHAVLESTESAKIYNLQIRDPLTDHRMFEFAASLPSLQSHRGSETKYVVRRAVAGYLPPSVTGLREKSDFTPLARKGMRFEETVKMWSLMTNMRAAELGYVNEARLRRVYSDYLEGKHEDTRFWHTLTLEDWLRRYF
ncbi:MAG: asparagine synthase-related protein [Chloroflexi bacterium]|nr:asparagine synthase-related protein [Chloroflexota bacterium]